MHIYPDVRMDLRLFNDRLDVFAGVKGGDRLNSYSSLKAANHHFNTGYAAAGQEQILSCTREFYDVFAGLGGSIGSLFQYNVVAGHSKIGSDTLLAADRWGNASLVLGNYSMDYIDASTTVATNPVPKSAVSNLVIWIGAVHELPMRFIPFIVLPSVLVRVNSYFCASARLPAKVNTIGLGCERAIASNASNVLPSL